MSGAGVSVWGRGECLGQGECLSVWGRVSVWGRGECLGQG